MSRCRSFIANTPLRVWILFALVVYCVWGALLIAQKPGLHYDEAVLVAGAVDMHNSLGAFTAAKASPRWICISRHCVPLMSVDYVGAVKVYLILPLFSLFGPRATLIRIVSLFLGALGIWGVGKLVAAKGGGRLSAAAVTLILALNPAYISMVVFDNTAVGAMMAGLGLVCASLALYIRRSGITSALLLGLSIGFGVWTKANFLWTILAAGMAILLVYRRKILIPIRELVALITGGLVGGSPFLLFQVFSGAATWRDQAVFVTNESTWSLLRYRVFLFSDMLFTEGEHRRMWDALMSPPEWQLWVFPIMVAVSCVICLGLRDGGAEGTATRTFALAFVLLAATLFFSRLALAEHHFIATLPLAVVVVVLACRMLQARYAWGRFLTAGLALLYGVLAVTSNLAAINGLRNSGGIGDWSDGVLQLANHLDQEQSADTLKILDWGFQQNLYVLTDGRLKSREIFSGASDQFSDRKRPWAEEIREGGRFLLPGPENLHFMAVSGGFRRALAEARPVTLTWRAVQRDGSTYAQIIEIEPDSARGPLPGGAVVSCELALGDPRVEAQLTGFYPFEPRLGLFYQIDQDGWRWTRPEFSVLLGAPESAVNGGRLLMHLYVPGRAFRQPGTVTLVARVDGHELPPQSYDHPGLYTFERAVPLDWLQHPAVRVDFNVNESDSPSSTDHADLGILVRAISIDPA